MSDDEKAVIDGHASDPATTEADPVEPPAAATTALVRVQRAEGTLMPLPAAQVVEGMRAYQQLLRELLEPSDWQTHDKNGRPLDRPFLKKSGWRKIARAFNLSFERIHSHVDRDEDGTPVRAEVWIRAVAPNGQYGDGDGYCSVDEGRFKSWRGRQKLENDLRTTATTRAKNRSIADLVGMGEVSAEEVAPGGEADEHAQALAAGARGSEELARHAFAALTQLLGDRERARLVGERIAGDHGYLPVAVGRALCHAATALTVTPATDGPAARPTTEQDSKPSPDTDERERAGVLELAAAGGYQQATLAALCGLLFDSESLDELATAQVRDLGEVRQTAAAGTDDDTLRRAVDRAASHAERGPARTALRQWLIERAQSAHPDAA
jgi:hypothetical protein